ncbi:pyruvate dehydrogenase complex dihydrolipoamide acetyltransferase component (E2) [Dispira simplex]|nr:pyruvate dehydrogenase complex dihydrolipoamide acetyltransferase component (E2) [Dispira simplex]
MLRASRLPQNWTQLSKGTTRSLCRGFSVISGHNVSAVRSASRTISQCGNTASPALKGLNTSIPCSHAQRLYSSKTYPPHTVISMPALSPTMTSGSVGVWQKQVGDEVVPGDVLVEIETDKAQMDFECQEEGYLAKILLESGTKDVPINQPIAVLVEDKDDIGKFTDFQPESAAAPAAAPKEEPTSSYESPAPTPEKSSPTETSAPKDRVFASPLAKTMAREQDLPLNQIKGTGPHGRIVKADVEKFVSSGGAAKPAAPATAPSPQPTPSPSPAGAVSYTDTPLSNMRRVIAARLTESKQQLPHYYLTAEVNMDNISKLRAALNEAANGEYKLSVNDFVIKASAQALFKVPEVNSAWQGDFIRQYHTADISVATATPNGLITPIIRNAEARGLSTISNTMKELAGRARANALKPEEYQGGSFTISNLGMFGIDSFTAIINPPQSCILAVGAAEQKLVPDSTAEAGFKVSSVMKATLSCDHRVVDGATGAQWLKVWKDLLENPLKLLL